MGNYRTCLVTACGVLLLICFSGFESHAQLLPLSEVKALQTIAQKLKNSVWNNISQSSCQGVRSSFNKNFTSAFLSNVTCNCSFPNNSCHVTNIVMKGLNLTGILPEELGNLTYLEELDLTRNYINGSIPTGLSRTRLRIISLLGNRLSGSIPKEIGDITTLTDIVLEDNRLEGPLPENLGSLSSLRRLLLSANNFTGTVPESFGNLKNLTDFRIDGSRISGKIPSFIGNWTNLDRLDMQGTSMEGPIPPSISMLTKLTQLRISDLNASSRPFPDLENLVIMERLVLRNCSLTGSIPDYIGQLTELKLLDLSFNKLTGEVPTTFQNLDALDFMFLTDNLLTGEVPSWILNNKNNFDLSYNNFSGSNQVSCQQLSVNLVSSYSSPKSSWCLRNNLTCDSKPKQHSMFINCGGDNMEYEGNQYEQDLSDAGPSNFMSSSEKWGYSSTGSYMGDDDALFKATNDTLSLNVNGSEFYQTARLAPLSLKYYGFCMLKGSYKVRLHFAEIMYTDGENFTGLGKRIFDVSIQGNVVLADFNIMEEAGGAGIGIVKTFDVFVNDFKVDLGGGLSAGAIAGIVVAAIVAVILVLGFLRYIGF